MAKPAPKPFDMSDLKPLDLSDIKPFYATADPSTLANVGLRLPENRRMVRRQQRRLTAMLKRTRAATETIERLPTLEESLHCVLDGSFALADFIPAVLALSGQPIDELWIATLGFSKKNVEALAQLVDAGQLRSLHVLCSHYFSAQDAPIYAQMSELCAKHGFRLAAMRTHAKVLLLKTGAHRIVVESSANLRSCFNSEQATLFNDRTLFDFHAAWIGKLLTEATQ
jgi:hypothetical protein